MSSRVIKRSVLVDGQKTSVSLEDEFWLGLKEIVDRRATTMIALLSEIEANRTHDNLSSAIRVYVLTEFKRRAGQSASHQS